MNSGLVTGVAGFIGSHLDEGLPARNGQETDWAQAQPE